MIDIAQRRRVQELIQEGKYGSAEKILNKMLKDAPEEASTHNTMGDVLIKLDRKDKALEHFGKAGMYYCNAGLHSAALSVARKALRFDTTYALAHFIKAKSFEMQEKLQDARQEYLMYLKSKPSLKEPPVLQSCEAMMRLEPDEPKWVIRYAKVAVAVENEEALENAIETARERGLGTLHQLESMSKKLKAKLHSKKAKAGHKQAEKITGEAPESTFDSRKEPTSEKVEDNKPGEPPEIPEKEEEEKVAISEKSESGEEKIHRKRKFRFGRKKIGKENKDIEVKEESVAVKKTGEDKPEPPTLKKPKKETKPKVEKPAPEEKKAGEEKTKPPKKTERPEVKTAETPLKEEKKPAKKKAWFGKKVGEEKSKPSKKTERPEVKTAETPLKEEEKSAKKKVKPPKKTKEPKAEAKEAPLKEEKKPAKEKAGQEKTKLPRRTEKPEIEVREVSLKKEKKSAKEKTKPPREPAKEMETEPEEIPASALEELEFEESDFLEPYKGDTYEDVDDVFSPLERKRIGEYFIAEGLLDASDVLKALEIQKEKEPHRKLGDILVSMDFVSKRQLQEALSLQVEDMRRNLDRSRGDGLGYVELGNLLLEVGDFYGAIDAYLRACTIYRANGREFMVFELLEGVLDICPESLSAAKEIVRIRKAMDTEGQARAFYRLAVAYLLNDSPHEALAALEKAVSVDPSFEMARTLMEGIRPGLADSEDYTDIALILADIDRKFDKNSAKALALIIKEFKEGIANAVPIDDYNTHYDLGIAYLEMGLYREALTEFEQVLNSPDFRMKAREMLGRCCLHLERYDEAEDHFRKGLSIAAGNLKSAVGFHLAIAEVYKATGRLSQAERELAAAAKLDPDMVKVQNLLE